MNYFVPPKEFGGTVTRLQVCRLQVVIVVFLHEPFDLFARKCYICSNKDVVETVSSYRFVGYKLTSLLFNDKTGFLNL